MQPQNREALEYSPEVRRRFDVAPRQVPYHAGMIYFELDRSSPYWRKLATSSGLAIHVTGDFPELDMECWAIRD